MGILRKIFAKKESNEDERRGATQVILPDKVDKLVAVVRRGAKGPSLAKERDEYVWMIFKLINPVLYDILPKKSQIKAKYIETDCMPTDGFIDTDDIFDILDELKVPETFSSYLETLRFSEEHALIRLREEKKPDRENKVKLPEPYDIEGLPTDVMLMIIYESNEGGTTSSLYPAEPRIRYLPKKYLKDYELELLKKTEQLLKEEEEELNKKSE